MAFHYVLVKGVPGTNLLSKEWEAEEFEKQMDLMEDNSSSEMNRFLPYSELDEQETLKLRRAQTEIRNRLTDDFV